MERLVAGWDGRCPPSTASGVVPPRRGLLVLLGACCALLPGLRRAGAAEGTAVAVIHAAPPTAASAEHFTGFAQVTTTFQAAAPARASGGTVRFAPGARTDWHTHPLGQTLVVLDGTGIVQQWGDPARHIGPGDVALIPPGAKHWHGAGPNASMAHVAVSERQDGRTVDWLEKVSDGQYAAAVAQAAGDRP